MTGWTTLTPHPLEGTRRDARVGVFVALAREHVVVAGVDARCRRATRVPRTRRAAERGRLDRPGVRRPRSGGHARTGADDEVGGARWEARRREGRARPRRGDGHIRGRRHAVAEGDIPVPERAHAGPRRDHGVARHGARVVGVHVRRRGVAHRRAPRRGAHGPVHRGTRRATRRHLRRRGSHRGGLRAARRVARTGVPLRGGGARRRHPGRRRRAPPGEVHPPRASAVHDRLRQRPRRRHRLRAAPVLRGPHGRTAVHHGGTHRADDGAHQDRTQPTVHPQADPRAVARHRVRRHPRAGRRDRDQDGRRRRGGRRITPALSHPQRAGFV